jgi:Arc/MetJ-type ribon-helix-helix transcriptional regulator
MDREVWSISRVSASSSAQSLHMNLRRHVATQFPAGIVSWANQAAVLSRGAYKSVEEVVEAALTAVEQRTVPGFAGTPEELDTLLAEGLASKQFTEDEFWSSVSKRTDALLAEHKTTPRS